MKPSKAPDSKLTALRAVYLQMPYHGAALNVSKEGTIDNGMVVIASFKSASSACRQLRIAGFLPTRFGWFIYEKANRINAGVDLGSV